MYIEHECEEAKQFANGTAIRTPITKKGLEIIYHGLTIVVIFI